LPNRVVNIENAMQLIDIAEYWSFWTKPFPKSIPRNMSYPDRMRANTVLAIQGVWRCGKSTLLTQVCTHYNLDPKQCLFLNFEDPRLVDALNTDTLDEVVLGFSELHPQADALYYFFDEIQNVKHWHKWILSRIERPTNAHFVVTGSNANLLSQELGSILTGRHTPITFYPFSFEERRAHDPKISLTDYLQQGGFPALLDAAEPERVLRQYFSDIIDKDVLARLGIGSPQALRQLAKIIFESTSSECSFRKLAGVTGLSSDTVASYIYHCESAYLFLHCPFFSFSEKQRRRRNSKYYPIDPALRQAVVTKTGNDKGKAFEQVVFLELKRFYDDVFYWKGAGEVDFVIQNSEGIWPIQATLGLPKERHSKALEEFYSNFPNAREETICSLDNFTEVLNFFKGMAN